MSQSKRGLMSPSPSTSPTNPFLSSSASPSSQNLLSQPLSSQSHSAGRPSKLKRSPSNGPYSSQSPTASRPLLSQTSSAPHLQSFNPSGRPSPSGYASSAPRIGVTSPSPGSTPMGMPITPGREGPPITFPHFQTPALKGQDGFGQLRNQPPFPSNGSRPSTNQSTASGLGKRISDGSSSQPSRSNSPHVMGNPFSDPTIYTPSGGSRGGLSSKFALHPDPSMWGYDVSPKSIEDDDWLHRPDKNIDSTGSPFTWRGCQTIGFMFLLALGLVGLFLGFPVTTAILHKSMSTNGGYNLGGINSTGQVMEGVFSLIDKDTDPSFHTKVSPVDGRTMQLVFSDEFNTDGRTFYPGDDPYFEAVDLNYWPTLDIEWYDPGQATTQDGYLVLNMVQERNHDMNFKSAMLQTWNKFCFTGGYIEVSVSLPGTPDAPGFWPGVWTMGNLGRAGYGATTEGLWPYSYDTCDLGTFPNQTDHNGNPETAAAGNFNHDGPISFLPGQRLSACTCEGSDHPGPKYNVGRSAPEIDILEAQIEVQTERGQGSQSLQVAPFDYGYVYDDQPPATTIYDTTATTFNSYKGGVFQQAASALTYLNSDSYVGTSGQFSTYGFEYNPSRGDDGYVTWIIDGVKTWTVTNPSIGPNAESQISQRLIPEEPMYIVLNFGMSPGFQGQDFSKLVFPAQMRIDYVRVYQDASSVNWGCSPDDHPTEDYINDHINAYTNSNLTTWAQAGYTFPLNSQWDGC